MNGLICLFMVEIVVYRLYYLFIVDGVFEMIMVSVCISY